MSFGYRLCFFLGRHTVANLIFVLLMYMAGYAIGILQTRQAYKNKIAKLEIKHMEDIESLVESMDAIKNVIVRHPGGDIVMHGEN